MNRISRKIKIISMLMVLLFLYGCGIDETEIVEEATQMTITEETTIEREFGKTEAVATLGNSMRYNDSAEDEDVTEDITDEKDSPISFNIFSYNVAHYNHDTSAYISDLKIQTFKSLLYSSNATFVAIQEDRPFIDANNTQTASSIIYEPVFPYVCGDKESTIRSKIQAADEGTLTYSNGRRMQYAVYEIEDNRVMIISTHPVANYNSTGLSSDSSIHARETQYMELFDWIEGKISLVSLVDTSEETAPEWDYCIICADFNCITDTDKENLNRIAAENNFVVGLGNIKEWDYTCISGGGDVYYSIDNVICSDNVEIEDIVVYRDYYDRLYSDHFPILYSVKLNK